MTKKKIKKIEYLTCKINNQCNSNFFHNTCKVINEKFFFVFFFVNSTISDFAFATWIGAVWMTIGWAVPPIIWDLITYTNIGG